MENITLKEIQNKCNEYNTGTSHRPALWTTLQNTSGTVAECGCGHGSTEILSAYCKATKRKFYSLENNKEWGDEIAEMYGVNNMIICDNYSEALLMIEDIDLLFIDHAPELDRKVVARNYANIANVIVIHDTEATGYDLQSTLSEFKYRLDFTPENMASTTIVSNKIDVSKWKI